MAYRVVHTEDWIITGANRQPARGFRVTITDEVTGDSFSLEVPNLNDETIKQKALAIIEQRKRLDDLKLD